MMKSMSAVGAANSPLPSIGVLGQLFVGGFAGLLIWEVWARLITVLVLGGPLEPAGLVTSLVQHWTGYHMPRLAAEAAHYAIGIVGYPIAYFIVSRAIRTWAVMLDVGVWAIFTAFLIVSLSRGAAHPFMGVFWLIVTTVTASASSTRTNLSPIA